MKVTEEDAKKKWCPLVRFHGTPSDDSLSNRDTRWDSGSPHPSSCIGSECMAWRVEEYLQPETNQPAAEWLMVPTGLGYCGMAGKP